MKLKSSQKFGNTGLNIPQIVYGTSYLGNIYKDIGYQNKLELVKAWFDCTDSPLVIDSAGKYGAGLSLETLGTVLRDLAIDPSNVVISNKLGWYRIPLTTPEPTFEPGVWENLSNDAQQRISYQGILDCWEQGNQLLGAPYTANLLSVHDPDEYLAAAQTPSERNKRMDDVIEAYRALFELKANGKAKAIGIGSKDWKVIRELYHEVKFDWVMIANSFTIMSHPVELSEFLDLLHQNGVGIINSAVFHGGFLTGGSLCDYRKLDVNNPGDQSLINWRDHFNRICHKHNVLPDVACIKFAISHSAIAAIALNTSKASSIRKNVDTIQTAIPDLFWDEMRSAGLISKLFSLT
jgi:D-threo-aldose 1-dehydrogenase